MFSLNQILKADSNITTYQLIRANITKNTTNLTKAIQTFFSSCATFSCRKAIKNVPSRCNTLLTDIFYISLIHFDTDIL